MSTAPETLRFGLFEVDLRAAELRRDGVKLKLQDKPFEVLVALLERPGDLVLREQLKSRLWPDGTYVEFDDGLNAAIAKLRQALGDSAENPRFVQTIPRRGYRFIAPVGAAGGGAAAADGGPAPVDAVVAPPFPWRWLLAGLGAGIGLAALTLVAVTRTGRRDVTRLENTVALTTAPGVEHQPAWSPDGSTLAYASDQLGQMDVWVRTLGETEGRALTADRSGYDCSPAWSPDGRWIAFASDHEGGGIDVIAAAGGPPRRLAPLPFAPTPDILGSVPTLAWSPDGLWIALAHGIEGRTGLFLIPAAGGPPRPIPVPAEIRAFSYVQPSWSPGGRRIAFAALTGTLRNQSRIWTVSPGGEAEAVAVTDGRALDLQPVWSDDGSRILFVSDRGGTADVWMSRVDSLGRPDGAPSGVTAGVGVGGFAVAKGGGRIAYSKTWERSNIWTVPAGSPPLRWSEARPVTAENHVLEFLDATRDGSLLVFDSNRAGNSDLWRLNPTTGELHPITREPQDEWHPSLSPDGRQVAFHGLYDGNREICIAPVAGGSATCLTHDPAKDWIPRWSPDGDLIAFNSDRNGDQDVFVVPSGGGDARVLARSPANDHNPAWSPDGRRVVFASNREGPDELYVVGRDASRVERITRQAWEDVVPLHWAAEDALYVWARGAGRPTSYWLVNPKDGAATPLFGGAIGAHQVGVALVRGGGHLFFPVWERLADLWVADLR